ncbi:hypothetical protein yc1106_06964 [Curvularia clavata]|uniref:Chromo domain-containing protein n=1 Tax=Curvularia clavata TaxID=95742 RepID=A0A9Q9DV58_CURCL|nr:hypothetical protein yc1106_06964 [Curvularia clavata]
MVLEGGPGRGRGRGRGRGKMQLWEWEPYKPSSDVYQQLWRIRKEPAIVTAKPPEECPIKHAQTRILDRRQTEGATVRNFYVVRITRADEGAERYETEYVDLSRILQYVSPAELERFENEQFRLEAEAEAIALREEMEELACRRLKVNARGRGRGRIVSTPGLPSESQPRARGRPRGKHGRGRGRPRAPSVRGDDIGERLGDDFGAVVVQEDEESQRVIQETEDEEEILESQSQPSPGLMRSAFVANSALSVSPIHRRFSLSTAHRPVLDEHGSPLFVAQQDQDLDEDDHQIKRLRLDSPGSVGHLSLASAPQIPTEAFAQAVLFSDRSSVVDLDSSPYPQTKPPASLSPAPEYTSHAPSAALDDSLVPQQTQHNGNSPNNDNSTEDEYVVESILEHYHDSEKIYYLVKWEGYEDSHDWLPEEDLEGARDLVAEYKIRVGIGKGRKKKGAFFS